MFHTAVTAYMPNYPTYKGNNFKGIIDETFKSIESKSYKDLLQNHQEDYHHLFKRMSFNLQSKIQSSKPTNVRLIEYANSSADLHLEELYFQ